MRVESIHNFHPHAFGMEMNGRKWQGTANNFRFSYNGKESASELASGDYDFGERILDGRVGSFLSVDPKYMKQSGWSPYAFAGNNPTKNIDVNGEYFTGNTKLVTTIYKNVSYLASKGDKEAIAFKSALERMDNSDIEFNINVVNKKYDGEGVHGVTEFNFKDNRVDIIVNNYFQDSGPNSLEGSTGHELEHGRQFMDGEIDFVEVKGKSIPGPSYDKTDEYKAIEVQNKIETASNSNKEVSEAKTKEQKKNYSKKQDGPFSSSKEKTEYFNSDKSKEKTKHSEYKSSFNFKATDKQKQEKKQLLENK